MEAFNKTVYLAELKRKLEQYYFATRGGSSAEDALAGLIGYVEAGLDLGVMTREEQQELVEDAYERVFGAKRDNPPGDVDPGLGAD